MNTQEFLELLLPDTGWIFTATTLPGKQGFANTPHTSIAQAARHLTKLTFEHKTAYFALATYEKDKVWDAAWKNQAGEVVGKFRTRTQANTESIKSFFLDLDVDPNDPVKFASKADSLREFETFRAQTGLPEPMIVDSGGGYHLYWPFHQPVATGVWKPVAEMFKALCVHLAFRADRSLTSDEARVLRAIGGYNFRRDAPVELVAEAGPFAFDDLKEIITNAVSIHGVQPLRAGRSGGRRANDASIPGAQSDAFMADDNLGAANDPINFDRAIFHCVQLQGVAADRGASAGEQLWRAALGVAKFAEPADLAYRCVSDGHAEYDEQRTIIKIANWRTGPTACSHFHELNPQSCEACPHYEKLTSPAQLGRHMIDETPIEVTVVDEVTGIEKTVVIPSVPDRYRRRKDGAILHETETNESIPEYVEVSPYNFYPMRISRQSGVEAAIDEKSTWCVVMPRMDPVILVVRQSQIADARGLYAFLLANGVFLSPEQSKMVQTFMSAYLKKLADEVDRERLYERLGWHASHTEFVLGSHVIQSNGVMREHESSRSVKAVTKDGMTMRGSVAGWKSAMEFYAGETYAGPRMFIYSGFGAPLFHMNDTGNKGVLMTASGASGRGKTTCLKACASIWGGPEELLLNGNRDGSTINALYEAIGTFHSLPFMWDDITERDADEVRRVLLNISQGAGKVRMKDGNGVSDRKVVWETIVLASANTDDVSRIMSSGKSVDPHLMRLIGVPFDLVNSGVKAKLAADNFLRSIKINHGVAGPVYMQQVVANYDKVKELYIRNVSKVDKLLNSANASAERFWSATVAAAYTGGKIAQALGLLPESFDLEADLRWMVSHLGTQRRVITESKQSSVELFAEFLELHIGNTLVVSNKQSSNLDNVVVRPHGALSIRHELDDGHMYVARAAVMAYCTEAQFSFKQFEADLELAGIITNRSALKVLGADTAYAKGQTRSWKINAKKMAPAVAAQQASKVVNIKSKVA